MADFSATWSASDEPISPYNLGTEARIEVPQAPEDRAKKGYNMILITQFRFKCHVVGFRLLGHLSYKMIY